MRLSLAFIVVGCLLATAGVALISAPAAFMTGGVLAAAVGVLLIDVDRRGKP